MVQAARSGRHNIAEGSRAAATSSQTELRLLNVARASLEELLLDYEDYLRQRPLPQWKPESPEARAVRAAASRRHHDAPGQPDLTELSDQQRWGLYAPWLEHADPARRANATICLLHQANFLPDRQLTVLERAFIQDGGYSEQLATARLSAHERGRLDRSAPPDPAGPRAAPPCCPCCGKPMALRTARAGHHPGRQFWGCTACPECKTTAEL